MTTNRFVSLALHVAGLLLLATGTVLLFEAGTDAGPHAHLAGSSLFANPVFIMAGITALVAGCVCLRRAVSLQEG